jgi:hypothetical protein
MALARLAEVIVGILSPKENGQPKLPVRTPRGYAVCLNPICPGKSNNIGCIPPSGQKCRSVYMNYPFVGQAFSLPEFGHFAA